MLENLQLNQGMGGVNLARQLKNLLLMRPLYELALTTRPFDDSGDLLFTGMDTNFLCLSLFDFVMEGSVFDFGRRREEVLEHLAQKARLMKPGLTVEQGRRIGAKIVDGLHNTGNLSRPFEYDYFDAASGEMKRFTFQLLRYTRSEDDVYCYRVTEEGYLVYLGMLDISAEDMQFFLDKLLVHLIQRGKVDEALHISDRSRRESMRYRESIREQLNRAHRSPESVSWRKDLEPFLDHSRQHIDERRKEGRKLVQVVQDQMNQVSDQSRREKFQALYESLDDERKIGLNLLRDVNEAGDNYRWAQAKMFSARRRQSLPDIEETLLPPLLEATVPQLAEIADENSYALLSLRREKQFFLGDMVEALTAERHEPAEATEEIEDVVAMLVPQPHFDEASIEMATGFVTAAMQDAFALKRAISSEAIIGLAEQKALPPQAQEYTLHLLYKLFAYPEEGMRVIKDGRFSSRIADAARLVYSQVTTLTVIEKEEE